MLKVLHVFLFKQIVVGFKSYILLYLEKEVLFEYSQRCNQHIKRSIAQTAFGVI